MPEFSVIIATFNRRALLEQALESVQTQSFTGAEIIVVDDGSTDDTMAFLESEGSAVRVVQQVNRGPGAARNAGTAVARGRYIAFLDSDDLWFPWSLAAYAEIIRRYDSPSFITGKPFKFEHSSELTDVFDGTSSCDSFADYYASGDEWRWWGASSFVIRADALRAAGRFVEENINGEDGDLALKLGAAPGFVQVTAPFTFGYREHGSNVKADLSKTLAGVWHKIRAEQAGAYPGGAARAHARWEIITRHVRPVALECLRRGLHKEARQLYRATFGWHLRLGRWKFLAGFPLMSLKGS